jgi:integrase
MSNKVTRNISLLSGTKSTEYTGVYEKDTGKDTKYIVRYTINKKTKTKVIGTKEEGVTGQQASIERLKLIHEEKFRTLENKTEKYEFIVLYNSYLSFRKPLIAHNTYKNLKSHKTKYYNDHFKGRDIRTIKTKELQLFANNLLKTKKPATVEKIVNGLKKFFRYLHEEGIIVKNESAKVIMPKYDNKKYFMLPGTKVNKIIKYIKNLECPKDKALFCFLLHGRRINEVLTLEWRNIDFQNKRYTIDYKYSKNRKTMIFSLEDFMIEALGLLNQNTKYIFENPKTKKAFTYTTAFRLMKLLKYHCEVDNMTIHDFRHLIGYLGINQGQSLEIIGGILGHSNIQSAQRYSVLKTNKVQQAFKKIYKEHLYC